MIDSVDSVDSVDVMHLSVELSFDTFRNENIITFVRDPLCTAHALVADISHQNIHAHTLTATVRQEVLHAGNGL